MVDLIGDQPDATPATHHIQTVRPIEKTGAAANLVRDYGRTIVFVRTREGADSVRESLQASGIQAGSIHGGMSQGQRERSLESFRHGRVDALVATDVAARGIHIDGVELVLHWDIAMDPKDYTHRSGRTARAGSAGTVITLVTDRQAQRAQKILKLAGVTVERPGKRPRPVEADAEGVIVDTDDIDAADDAPVVNARPGQHGGVKTVSELAARPRVRSRRPQSPRPS